MNMPSKTKLEQIVTVTIFEEDIDNEIKMLKYMIIESRRIGINNKLVYLRNYVESRYSDLLKQLDMVDEELKLPQ